MKIIKPQLVVFLRNVFQRRLIRFTSLQISTCHQRLHSSLHQTNIGFKKLGNLFHALRYKVTFYHYTICFHCTNNCSFQTNIAFWFCTCVFCEVVVRFSLQLSLYSSGDFRVMLYFVDTLRWDSKDQVLHTQ